MGWKENNERNHKTIDGVEYKICLVCNLWFEMNRDNFYKSKRNKDGFHSWCRSCSINKSKIQQEDKRDQAILYKRRWYRWNKKSEAEKSKIRNQDPEKRKKKSERSRLYFKNNLKKAREYSRKHHDHVITKEQWAACKAYFENSCAYCGISEEDAKEKYGQGLHKEHVIPKGRDDIKNCVPACLQCNSEKNIHSLHNWYNESNSKYDKKRYMRIVQWFKYKFRRTEL